MRAKWLLAAALGAAGVAWWMWSGTRRPLQRGAAQPLLEQPHLEAWALTLERGGATVGRLVSVHASPTQTRPRLVMNRDRTPLAAVAPDAAVVANAGFFTPEFRPTGLLVSDGEVLHPFVDHGGAAGTGVLVWRDDGTIHMIPRDEFELTEVERIRIAVQAGPRLIEPDGRPGIRSDDGISANRTVVGRDRAGRFVVVAAQTFGPGPTGPSLWEMMRLLGDEGLGAIREDLALELALNLDGGPSTGLFVRPADVRLPEGEVVPTALVLESPR